MESYFQIEAIDRKDLGRKASKKLRREKSYIPAIIYGNSNSVFHISINHNKILDILKKEKIFSSIINILINKKKEKVILQDIQYHPYKTKILHIDFKRIDFYAKLKIKVPLYFKGIHNSPGIKSGGKILYFTKYITILVLPKFLPQYIEVDVSNMKINQILYFSQIPLPIGVSIFHLVKMKDNRPICKIEFIKSSVTKENKK